MYFQNLQNYLLDAIDLVLTWEIPEDKFADAVNAQASLMAGINPDEIRIGGFCSD